MKYLFTIVTLSFLPMIMYGQDSNLGNWFLLFGNKQLSDKVNWHHEVQYRNYNFAGDLEQLLLRTGIGVNIAPKTNLLGGYGFIRSENYINADDKIVINEHRIFQQLITRQQLNKVGLQHRYRFEQRFVEDDFRLRFRYFLGFSLPLSSDERVNQFYLSAYNEIFINTENTIFDRNRLYGGLGLKVSDNLRFEVGYMNQFFSVGGRDQLNLVTFFNW